MKASTGEALVWLAATENRFAVLDAVAGAAPEDPGALAVRLARAARPGPDGLLVVLPPRVGGDVRMQVWNADGSRAEACGNGLRCVAKLAVERGHAAPALVVETDAGPRRVAVELADGAVVRARAELGRPRSLELGVELALGGHAWSTDPRDRSRGVGSDEAGVARGGAHVPVATAARSEPARHGDPGGALSALDPAGASPGSRLVDLVDLGNPHCVLRVVDVASFALDELGPRLEHHARFPGRTNVEVVETGAGVLRVRIWERGVGETRSCGTGAAAAAAVMLARSLARSPVEVVTPGGTLVVERDGPGVLWLSGGVESWRPELAG